MSRGLSMLNDWCGMLFRFKHHIAVVADVENADRDRKTALLRLRPKTEVKITHINRLTQQYIPYRGSCNCFHFPQLC